MNKISLLVVLLVSAFVSAQQPDQKVILISLDGYRWQELFNGADSLLIDNKDYVGSPEALKDTFWADTPEERRKKLTPFIWNYVVKNGQIHGNRSLGSKVDLTNSMWFSYPGYNEILTGKADDKNIHSNDKIYNPNKTVLELLNEDADFKGKVAAFASWDVFPYIINDKRSAVPVNAGFRKAEGELTDKEQFLNQLQDEIPSPWGSVRLDAFTHHYALEYMKKNHPKMIYIGYGETDDFAHDGNYQAYLNSAHTTDDFIRQIWEYVQSDAFYKDQTTLLIVTDHGRGTQPLDTWRGHGSDIKGANEVWLIALGNKVTPKGELKVQEQLYNNQLVPSILKILGKEELHTNLTARPLLLNTEK